MPKLVVSARPWTRVALACGAALALLAACNERPGRTVTEGANPTPPLTPLMGAEVLVGAGDIASCNATGDEATAALLDRIPGTVFTAGDNVYPNGTADEFRACYGPTWGRHRARTFPVPGNHDYRSTGAAPYFAYFGERAGPRGKGFYSFELGEWLILMLNTNIAVGAESEQAVWLRAQLAGRSGRCEIAIAHHPRFSSGPHGSERRMSAIWQILYEAGVELALAGHDHNYERFAPMNPAGTRDEQRGVRQFVVGTGGFKPYRPRRGQPNSEVLAGATGVIKLSLGDGLYQWEFVPVARETFRDWGGGRCR
ncbi:MAG: metallophosphoesterase family protein [Gemmatimonadaceae bacterium]